MDFREYIKSKVIKKNDRILEFGPLTRPLASKDDYPNTYYADIRSTNDIKSLYASSEYLKSTGLSVDLSAIVDIDYVVSENYANTFKDVEKFDVVLLSHVIEHMPDIIYFFKDILSVMKKDGKLVIIYPDSRYCFDHFRNGTSFIDAYDAYINKKAHSKGVFDFMFNVVKENRAAYFWNDLDITDKLPVNKFIDALNGYNNTNTGNLPDDVHFWPFSDYQFVRFLYDMDRANLLSFRISSFFETQVNNQEFMVILSPKSSEEFDDLNYKRILNSISPAIKSTKLFKDLGELIAKNKELQQKAGIIYSENKFLQEKIDQIQNSRSWKIVEKIKMFKNLISK